MRVSALPLFESMMSSPNNIYQYQEFCIPCPAQNGHFHVMENKLRNRCTLLELFGDCACSWAPELFGCKTLFFLLIRNKKSSVSKTYET